MRIRYYSSSLATWCRHLYFLRQSLHNGAPAGPVKPYQTERRFVTAHVEQRGFTKYTQIPRKGTSKEVDEFVIEANDDDYMNDDDDDDDDNNDDDFYDDTDERLFMDKMVGRHSGEHLERISLKPDSPPGSKILRVAIIGAPNSGKSTLINSLMGWKLNGVSSKVHTTEKNSFSVYSQGKTQIVFTDTPGVMTQMERVRHSNSIETMEAPGKSVLEADIIGIIVDVGTWYERKFRETVLQILHDHADKPSFLILNKIDLLKEDSLILTVTRKLTNGIIDGKEFGKKQPIRSEYLKKDPDAILLREEGFNDLYEHLKKKYGKFENLDGLEADYYKDVEPESSVNEENIDDIVENNLDALEADYCKGEELETSVNEENIGDIVENNLDALEADYYKSEEYESLANEENIGDIVENKEVKSETAVKLEDDSFQREFLEDILRRSKSSSADADRYSAHTSSHETEGKDEPEVDTTSWISKIEEHKQIARQKHWSKFKAVFPVSALTGAGIGYLMEFLDSNTKLGAWQYHSSVVTDQDPAEIAKMCVRQALLDNLSGRLPYLLDPEIVYWNVDGSDRLDVVMELVVKNTYEQGFLLGQDSMKPPFAAGLNQYEKRKQSQRIARKEQFSTPVSVVTKVASDAKQALLDVFRCEMKFKLTVRRDSSVKRDKQRRSRHVQKLTKRYT